MVRLALAVAGLVLLPTCTYSNLCPKVCLEEGCCDPSCRTPGDDRSGFDFCCPIHQPTVGSECTNGLQCVFPHGVDCECDSGQWVCAGLDGGSSGGSDLAPLDGGTSD
jgi:hypothetical protein